MTEDDWRRFNGELRQTEECKQENKSKQVTDKKISECVSVSNKDTGMMNNNVKIVEKVALENKILNNDDNNNSVVVVEKGRETDQSNENKDDQVIKTDNKV